MALPDIGPALQLLPFRPAHPEAGGQRTPAEQHHVEDDKADVDIQSPKDGPVIVESKVVDHFQQNIRHPQHQRHNDARHGELWVDAVAFDEFFFPFSQHSSSGLR